jgi:acyl-CoA thioesterase-1
MSSKSAGACPHHDPVETHGPLWEMKGMVRGEPLLFVKNSRTGTFFASLAFRPVRLSRIVGSTGEEFPLKDFFITEKGIGTTGAVHLPFLDEKDVFPEQASDRTIGRHLDGVRFLHFSEGSYFHGLQVHLDYETDEEWNGPVPEAQGCRLPSFLESLRGKEPVSVVLLGDSISEGANASGVTGVAPFQSSYGDLFIQRLKPRVKAPIQFHNLSKGGMNSCWGVEQRTRVSQLAPHLVILAFGMNDASCGITADTFYANISRLIAEIRGERRDAEFLLVSGMSPNPAWHLSNTQLRQEQHDRLAQLAGPGVAICDVRSVWDEMVRRKGTLGLTGNGVNHPNDYGHRVYCDCLMAVVGQH